MSDLEHKRILISVDADWKVTISCPALGLALPEHPMQKFPDGKQGFFPGPPAEQMPPIGEPHSAICRGDAQAFWKAYDAITRDRQPTGQEFGMYLFETLIGNQIWQQEILPKVSNQHSLELALMWAASDQHLHRLNWELMHCCGDFLAANPKWRIAFTRVIAGTSGTDAKQLRMPPRVLTVIGTSLTNPDIKAGAEYLGLLRRIERGGNTIHTRIIQNASLDRIKREAQKFQPDVIHFICHGYYDTRGSYLTFQEEDTRKDKAYYADQIANAVLEQERPPQIIVLSSCYSGIVTGVHLTAPLAAELVARGIPIVVGMAGRVSDLACRLFTRRFGEALVMGEPLVDATALGRRAAHEEGESQRKSIDWAFPSLFMAQGVEPEFRPVNQAGDEFSVRLEKRVRSYPITRHPVFCGREDFLEVFRSLFDPGELRRILLAHVAVEESGYGKTRLLQELATYAVRDGHIPILISPPKIEDAPHTPVELGFELLRAIGVTYETLELPPPLDSQLLMQFLFEYDFPEVGKIRSSFANNPKMLFSRLLEHINQHKQTPVSPDLLGEALRSDLVALGKAARQADPFIQASNGQVVVLLDELHRYGEALEPLINRWLTHGYGLGNQEMSVPVAMAYSESTPADHILRDFKEANHGSVKRLPLGAFREDGEDLLAYECVWLNPPEQMGTTKETGRGRTVREDAPDALSQKWIGRFREKIKGIPANLSGDWMLTLTEWATDETFLMPANDEKIMKDRIEKERGGG